MALLDNNAAVYERVWYTPYGEARHHWGQDYDGDRGYDFDDTLALLNVIGSGDVPIDDPAYVVEMDRNRDGVLDADDLPSGSAQTAVALGQISDLDATSGPDNWFGYAGYVWEGASGQYHVRNRNYRPDLGRWLQRDPAGYVDGMGLYEYVRAQPSILSDHLGLLAGGWKRKLIKWGGIVVVVIPVTELVIREVQDVMYDSRDLTQQERACVNSLLDMLMACTDQKYQDDVARVRKYMDGDNLSAAELSGTTYGYTQPTVTGFFSKIWISTYTLSVGCTTQASMFSKLLLLKTVMHETLHAGHVGQSASEAKADSYELDLLDDIKSGIESGECLCSLSDKDKKNALTDIERSKEETWDTKKGDPK